jgi:hypothetical protein
VYSNIKGEGAILVYNSRIFMEKKTICMETLVLIDWELAWPSEQGEPGGGGSMPPSSLFVTFRQP